MKESGPDFLSPEIVSRISSLDLIARLVVEGFITGLHRSPYHGFSVEFAEHRQYMPGDSLKYMDWKVYARSDKMFIKSFEEETNLKSHILLDCSGSMGFCEKGHVSKMRYGSILAATLSFLMLKQRDSVGLLTFADSIKRYLPPRSVHSQLKEIIKELSAIEAEDKTSPGQILDSLAERISARGLIIIISDLLVEPESLIHALKHFRHNGHEVLVMQVLDPAEIEFDYKTETRFIDMETGEKISTQPWLIGDEYRKHFDNHRKTLIHSMHDIAVDYALFTTDVPFERALAEYLAKRKKLH